MILEKIFSKYSIKLKINSKILPSKTVDERDDLAPVQEKLFFAESQNRRLVLVENPREQYFESSSQSLDLKFSPKLALVAADAVHYLGYVSEVLLEFVLQSLGLDSAVEHYAFVEVLRECPKD